LLSISILSLASLFSGITFENPTDESAWPTSVPWSGIHPRLAVTLRSDTMFQAEPGVHLETCSRVVFIFLPVQLLNKLFSLLFQTMVCIDLLKFENGL
jgi:hypothetical protein